MDSSLLEPKKKAKNPQISHSEVQIICKKTKSNSELNTKENEAPLPISDNKTEDNSERNLKNETIHDLDGTAKIEFLQNSKSLLLDDEEIRRKDKQEILTSLLEKKAHFDGQELRVQISQIDERVLNAITEDEIELFCLKSRKKKRDPESIMSRIFIPKVKNFEMAQVLQYNALYPWDVEKENDSNCWTFSLPVLTNLAYATCYGHPKTADMLWGVCGGVMLHEYKKQIVDGFEALHAKYQTSCREYIYYLPEPTCNRSDETYLEFLEMPYQDAAKHFQKLLWISEHSLKK